MDILQKMINEFAELYSESSAMRPISAYMGLSSEEYQLLIDNKVTICTPNERAFLDEIRESFEFDYDKNLWCRKNRNMLERSYIYRSDFTRSNLSELVEGKG
jgi:hypothetical protein